jgi:hypothetical protein
MGLALSSVRQNLTNYLLDGIRIAAVEHEVIGCGPQRQCKNKHLDHKGGPSSEKD